MITMHVVFADGLSRCLLLILVVGGALMWFRVRASRLVGSVALGMVLAIVPVALWGLLVIRWGTPCGVGAFVFFLTVSGVCWYCATKRYRSQVITIVVSAFVGCALATSSRCTMENDLRNGLIRNGLPGGIKCAKRTEATEIIWRYLGRGRVCWSGWSDYPCRVAGIPVSDIRDGDFAIDAASPALHARILEQVLESLPSRPDRVHLLQVITDCHNYARWRQNALAVALFAHPSRDREENRIRWEKHAEFFVVDRNERPSSQHESWEWLPLLQHYTTTCESPQLRRDLRSQMAKLKKSVVSLPDEIAIDLRFHQGRSVHAASQCSRCHRLPQDEEGAAEVSNQDRL